MLWKVTTVYTARDGTRQRVTGCCDCPNEPRAKERVGERIKEMSKLGVQEINAQTAVCVPYGVEFLGHMPE